MSIKVIEIRELADDSAKLVGLDKHKRSKIPGTSHGVQARTGPDGRYITGIDELSCLLQNIEDEKARNKEIKRRRELRTQLERLLNQNLDAMSPYWETFTIDLATTKLLNVGNPKDELKYEFLMANEHVAPDEASASNPEYRNCKYVFYRKDVSDSNRVGKQRTIDKAKAGWVMVSENSAKAKIYAAYCLGSIYNSEYGEDAVYGLMSEWLNDLENAKHFNSLDKMKHEDLQVKIAVDYALSKNVIRVREGYYQRGNVTYGRNPEDTIAFFQKTMNAGEFDSLMNELRNNFNYKL